MNRYSLIFAIALLVVAIAAAGWFGFGWIQVKRADAALNSANSHIEAADALMAQIDVENLGQESFTSLENINLAAEATRAMPALIDEAVSEIRTAGDEAGSAAGMTLLPQWYRQYLEKKQETAGVRVQQLAVLGETADRLQQLYAAGPLVFSSTQEMDRLFGQFQAAMARVQSASGEAGATLRQVSQSFTQVQAGLDQARAANDFEVLAELSQIAEKNAELSALAAQLADAAGAGDQAAAQQAASQLEERLLTASVGVNTIDSWRQARIKPLERENQSLQSQEDSLDQEAASLFIQNRG